MASFFQGIFQNVMNPGTNQGSGGTLTSGGIGAQASTMPTGASASSAAGTMGNIGGGVDSSALDSGTLDLSALPDQCQQVEDTIEPLRAALEKISKRADKCLVRKQPEEALQDAFHQSALSMRTRSNLFDCVLNGLAVTETELMQRREDLNEEITKWSAGLRDRERRLVDLQQQRRSLTRLASDLTKLRRRLGHAMQKQQASSGGGGGGGGSDAVGELQLEVSTRENEERKERDAYIVQLNSLQGEKPAHCQQLLQLMQARLNYHKNCLGHLEKQLPYLQAEVSRITKLSGPCYGTPLGDHLARTGRRIAYVIDVCTAALRRDDIMDEEGLFRVNGPTSSVQKLESFLDVMQAETEISRYDSASICGALKKYLKQLPEPLIGQSLLPDWKKACAFASSDERRMALHSCCSELHRRQPQYYENLRHLIKFLSLVCDRQERNKMSPKNLGICIGPNIVGTVAQQLQGAATLPANGSSATLTGIPGSTTASAPNYDDLHSANLGTLIVENLIVHQEFCFGSEDLRSPPSDFAANNQQRLRSMSNLNSSNLCTTPFEPKFMNLPSNLSIPPAQSPTSAEAPCVGAVAMPTQASNDFQQQHQLLQQHSLSVSTTTIGDGSEAAAAASSARSADTRSHSGSVGGGTQHTQTPQQQQQLLQSPVRHRKPQAPLPPQQQQQQQQQQSSTISSRSHVREPSIGGQSSTGSVDSSSSTFLPSGQSAAAAATTASTTAIKRMGHSTFSAVDSNEVTNF